MDHEQEADVKSDAVSQEEESSSEETTKRKRLDQLQPVRATLKEPKPQHTCGVKDPGGDVSGGAVPRPQFQCGVKQPNGDVNGGVKKKPDSSN